jgi:hypothetical protein
MIKVAQILLRAYLRRNPINVRLSQFNFLSRYSWMKNVLEELRPEIFPQRSIPQSPTIDPPIAGEETTESLVHHPLIGQKLRGLYGTYEVESGYAKRGQGTILQAIHTGSQNPVAIKVFEFSIKQEQPQEFLYHQQEIQQRQQQFADQAWLNLADGRSQDFRIPKILDAIKDDRESQEGDRTFYRCYLVTDQQACLPTLRQTLQAQGAKAPQQVRKALSQILQTLDFLHRQKFVFQSGQPQLGLIHGNLSLDSVLQTVVKSETPTVEEFFYLTDLLLWERIFSTPMLEALPSIQSNSSKQIAQDLKAVGQIGLALLTGQTTAIENRQEFQWPQIDLPLEQLLRKLLGILTPFDTAAAARQALLTLEPLYATNLDAELGQGLEPPLQKRQWSKIQLAGFLAIVALLSGLIWASLSRRDQVARSQVEPINCCMKAVSAVPKGDFTYATIERGSWDYVLRQSNLVMAGQKLTDVLDRNQEQLSLNVERLPTIAEVLEAVQSGEADFAVLPLFEELPPDLVSREIAYDGLAAVVHFSYSARDQGLPVALNGQLSLDQIRQIYAGDSSTVNAEPLSWSAFGGPKLLMGRSVLDSPETLTVLGQMLSPAQIPKFQPASDAFTINNAQILSEDQEKNATQEMLRRIINDFEDNGDFPIGRIGLLPLSQVKGQCSVYPLAIRGKTGTVQPWLIDGKPITPGLDLCHRKGDYQPDVEAFKNHRYALAYPVAVIYPNDNRRSAVGKKFAELMLTQEGQKLISDAGLVAIHTASLQVQKAPVPTVKVPTVKGSNSKSPK